MTNVTSVKIKAVKLLDKLRNLCQLVFATVCMLRFVFCFCAKSEA